jgi:hypothetical protein
MSVLIIDKTKNDFNIAYDIFTFQNGFQQIAIDTTMKVEQNRRYKKDDKRIATIDTFGVKARKLKELYTQFKTICLKPILIKIEKENCLIPAMCHTNSEFIEQYLGYKRAVGWNITACPCGNLMGMEIHSCNIKPDGKYVDYTEDFDELTNKYFMPIKNVIDGRVVNSNSVINKINFGADKCRCHINWGIKTPKLNTKRIIDAINIYS